MDMAAAASINKNNLNGKLRENMDVTDSNSEDKQKHFERMLLICRKVGDVFKRSAAFQMDDLTNLVNVKYEKLISWIVCHDVFCKNINAKEILTDAVKKLPESKVKIVCTVSDYFFMSGTTDEEKQKSLTKKDIFGVFFANLDNQNKIYESVMNNYNFDFDNISFIEKEGNRFSEELGLLNRDYANSILLIFGNNNSYLLLTSILKQIKSKVPSNHNMNWIYMFYEQLEVVNSNKKFHEVTTTIMAIRITGLNIDSWSESFYYKTTMEEFLNKLKELNKQLNLKRHCLGLLFSPKCIFATAEESPYIRGILFSNPADLINSYVCDHSAHQCCVPKNALQCITDIFPNIPFLGIFYSSLLSNEEKDISTEMEDINSIFVGESGHYAHKYGRVMIITYD